MYRWVDHTSELELQVEAGSPEAVFTEALSALGEVLPEPQRGTPTTREVRLSAADPPALFAAWLEELVYLAETDGFIAERAVSFSLDGSSLAAVVEGESSLPQTLIKAVTYHQLQLEQGDGLWRARAVLDV